MRRRLRSIQLSGLEIKVISGRTAIIGAGLTGFSCGRVMLRHDVELFGADRIIGGRMTTMRIGLVRYNHGAQDIKSYSSIFHDLISVFVMSSYAA